MAELLQANWWLLVLALLIGIIVAWWALVVSRKTTVKREEKSEDAKPAARNQALIDAPPAAAAPPLSPPPLTAVPQAADLIGDNAGEDDASDTGKSAEAGNVEAVSHKAAEPEASSTTDDLTQIKGVGPKLVVLLQDQGVSSFAQIAAWDDAAIDRIDAKLGRFQGRIRRDSWVEQARFLADGDIAGYQQRFGQL